MSGDDLEAISFRCILPRDRLVFVQEGRLLPGPSASLPVQETEVQLVDSEGSRRLLSLSHLGETMGFEYASRLVFLHERDLRDWLLHSIDKEEFRSSREMGLERAICRGELGDCLIVGFVDTVIGYGLFTSRDRTEGEFIGEYVGVVTSSLAQDTAYSVDYPSMTGGYSINAGQCGNLIRFVNHSSAPNAQFVAVSHRDGLIHVVCVRVVTW